METVIPNEKRDSLACLRTVGLCGVALLEQNLRYHVNLTRVSPTYHSFPSCLLFSPHLKSRPLLLMPRSSQLDLVREENNEAEKKRESRVIRLPSLRFVSGRAYLCKPGPGDILKGKVHLKIDRGCTAWLLFTNLTECLRSQWMPWCFVVSKSRRCTVQYASDNR